MEADSQTEASTLATATKTETTTKANENLHVNLCGCLEHLHIHPEIQTKCFCNACVCACVYSKCLGIESNKLNQSHKMCFFISHSFRFLVLSVLCATEADIHKINALRTLEPVNSLSIPTSVYTIRILVRVWVGDRNHAQSICFNLMSLLHIEIRYIPTRHRYYCCHPPPSFVIHLNTKIDNKTIEMKRKFKCRIIFLRVSQYFAEIMYPPSHSPHTSLLHSSPRLFASIVRFTANKHSYCHSPIAVFYLPPMPSIL